MQQPAQLQEILSKKGKNPVDLVRAWRLSLIMSMQQNTVSWFEYLVHLKYLNTIT